MRLSVPIAIAMTVVLAECSYIPSTEAHREAVARTWLKSEIPDSESAKIEDVHQTRDGSMLCGMVNAKNLAGAYTGYVRFIGTNGGAAVEGLDFHRGDVLTDKAWDSCRAG